jgi:hypothetical protein
MLTSIQSVQPSFFLRPQQLQSQIVDSNKVEAKFTQQDKDKIIQNLDKQISVLQKQLSQAYVVLSQAKGQIPYLNALGKVLTIQKNINSKEQERQYWINQPVDNSVGTSAKANIDGSSKSRGCLPLESIKTAVMTLVHKLV